MKRAVLLFAVLSVIMMSAVIVIVNNVPTKINRNLPFYVGVSYSGDNITDAKLLIDRVKNYTNLFVLQSGPLMYNVVFSEQILDYAVASGLNIVVSYSTNSLGNNLNAILDVAPSRWGSHFLGLYFNDEPGGHMLDSQTLTFSDNEKTIVKDANGQIILSKLTGSGLNQTLNQYIFDPSGIITITSAPSFLNTPWSGGNKTNQVSNSTRINPTQTIYYPNGTIRYTDDTTLTYEPNGQVFNENNQLVTDRGNVSQFQPYQQIWDLNPLLNYTDAANIYVNNLKTTLSSIGNQTNVKLFTSDYALYWWDYKSGYDTIFAELGWNNTAAQEIDLVRGAANLQGKAWGTIITWTYTRPPYLTSGDEMYNQMRLSYECGAKYVVIFNYAKNMTDSYGTLQEEHFQALQRFWKEVVQNDSVVHGGIKAETVLVLPKDYGWGMRTPNDTIWGLWKADGTSQQVWNRVQNKIAEYGSKLDIVYDDGAYPVIGKYDHVFYWNQTD
ncbi:MAG: hypothetical protein NWE98_02255 [Candidatus Bathyarchaeota archaeon]|nr:hypothetical protein [Candidatus Bathyarchaeota archaeon]